MKSLITSRPMVVLMVGIPGSGKSFFAQKFSDLFHTPVVSFDKLHYLLFSEPTFSKEEEVLVANLMNCQIQELFKTQRTFIVDGAMNTKMARLEIAKAARTHEYGLLVVWVQTDSASSRYRALNRSKKRSEDKYNFLLTSEQFESFAKRITPPDNREDHVVISGKHTFASQAKAVLKKIVAPRDIALAPVSRTIATSKPTRKSTKPTIVS